MLNDPNDFRTQLAVSQPICLLSGSFSHTSSGNWLALTTTTETDRFNMHNVSTNTERIVLYPPGGMWLTVATVIFAADATGQRGVKVVNQADTILAVEEMDTAASGTTSICVSTISNIGIGAARHVELKAYQNSGGTLSIAGFAFTAYFVQATSA